MFLQPELWVHFQILYIRHEKIQNSFHCSETKQKNRHRRKSRETTAEKSFTLCS